MVGKEHQPAGCTCQQGNLKGTQTRTHDAKDCVTFTAVLDSIIYNIMLLRGLVFPRFLHVCQAFLKAAHVNLRETFVEENLC